MTNSFENSKMKLTGDRYIWSLEQALAYLATARRLGVRRGLERIQQLLKCLGNPHNACPVVHVAGTNGKGSVSSMCAYIFAKSGKRTGLYTSPYLTNFNERIRLIDGCTGLEKLLVDPRSAEISDHDFSKVMMMIAYESEVMKTDGYDMPTEFEMITAAAFVYLAEMKCDLIILETGMGGKLDSTNVANDKIATVITSLSYDHMDRLGNSITEIAAEKAAIMRENVPTILYNPYDSELSKEEADAAMQVIETKAEELNSPLTIVKKTDIKIERSFITGQSFTYKNQGPYHIQFAGDFQSMNAALAIETCNFICEQQVIEDGIMQAQWPGRLECLSQSPFILIDGAHNLQGILALRKHLEKFLTKQKIVLLFGVLKNKDYHKMLDCFLDSELYSIGQVICTEPNFHRALAAEELAQEFVDKLTNRHPESTYSMKSIEELENHLNPLYNDTTILYAKDLEKATEFAYEFSRNNYLPLICFGSLYLIGDVRPNLLKMLGGIDS